MKRHVYYRIEMRLASPLSVGSGRNESTDHDVVRGKDGKPYIPASSIAGVFRHTLENDKSLQNDIFGMISGNKSQSSKIIFYDGLLASECVTSERDSVKLDGKVGVDGAKFDMQIVETGATFVSFLEVADQTETIDKQIDQMLYKLQAGILRFGSKTSRGYGAVKISQLKKAVFDLEQSSQLDSWLDFDPYEDALWHDINTHTLEEDDTGFIKISLKLKQKGALSIREYSTDVSTNGDTLPDYNHISLHDDDETGIVPGTSWAGAFRTRYREFAGQEETDALFGFVKEKSKNGSTKKSRIIFSESQIERGVWKTITRNSIDRFTAATKDAALYTERTLYNGETVLDIMVTEDITDREKAILGAVILDLHNGFLPVGGLTSVGRGIFKIIGLTVNGIDCYDKLNSNAPAKLLEVNQ